MLMNRASRIMLALTSLFLGTLAPLGFAQDDLAGRIQKSERSMVTVRTELTRVMHSNPPHTVSFTRNAAGIVIDASGIIVTNTHTIIHAPYIFVILKDGTRLAAKVIFSSRKYDFTFLKVHPPHPLKRVRWANSALVTPGERIIAIGNSPENYHAVMPGHITGVLKKASSRINDFLQMDFELYHGDSGGPILDEQGRLLGMIMARREDQPNASIAIASDKIHWQYLQLRK